MKTFFLTMAFFVIALAHCGGQDDLISRVRDAAKHEGDAYIEARDRIVSLGESVLPLLAEAATDEAMSWQERLAARISFERIARGEDIQALREHDWRQYPPYQPGPVHMLGPQVHMGPHVLPKMTEAGLWYHYMESYWKHPRATADGSDPRFEQWWNREWSRAAVENEPEGVYPLRILIDKLERGASFANRDHRYDYKLLSDRKIADDVPVLVNRHEDYYQNIIGPIEAFPGSHKITFRGCLEPILSFADVRHADLIKNYIEHHPALAPLRDRVAEVRARPAAPPLKDPPFRLGTEPVGKVLERIAAAWEPAFRQDVPFGFVPTPVNAILDLRTPGRLVWRVDGPLKNDLSRETRFFVQTREAARPEAWCSVVALHPGIRAVGLSEDALLVAHRAYGQNDSKPMPFGEQAALTVHRLEHFTADTDMPTHPAVFLGDTYGDSTVTDIAFEYPTEGEIQKLLHGKAREDSYRISFRVQATVDGRADRKILQGEAQGNIGELRRFLLDRDVGEFFAHRHPVLDIGRSGVSFWNGSARETVEWRDPDPPKPHPIPADLELDIQL